MADTYGRDRFDELYRAHYTELWRFAARLSGSEQVAEDVVQGVFLSIWARWSDWQPNVTVREYLFRAVRNEVYKLIEHERIVQTSEPSVAEFLTQLAPRHLDEQISSAELDEMMRYAVDALPIRQREAFLLRWNDDMNASQIARVLEISPTAATNLLNKAQDRLRDVAKKLLDH